METEKMISEGLSINQLEERLEMSNGIVCCSDGVIATCCALDVYTKKEAITKGWLFNWI